MDKITPGAITAPLRTWIPSTITAPAPMKALSSIITGARPIGSNTPTIWTPADKWTFFPIWAHEPTSSKEIGRELYIENEFHKAKGFRKLHIEVAEFSKNLKILHCVFFPDPKFDIPIFGLKLKNVE